MDNKHPLSWWTVMLPVCWRPQTGGHGDDHGWTSGGSSSSLLTAPLTTQQRDADKFKYTSHTSSICQDTSHTHTRPCEGLYVSPFLSSTWIEGRQWMTWGWYPGSWEKGLRKKAARKNFFRRIRHILSRLCDLVDVGGLTRSLKLLHPPEFMHGVLQTSDLVVVEEKKSEAGQVIQGPCVKDLGGLRLDYCGKHFTFYIWLFICFSCAEECRNAVFHEAQNVLLQFIDWIFIFWGELIL